jgi:hypothetical protein
MVRVAGPQRPDRSTIGKSDHRRDYPMFTPSEPHVVGTAVPIHHWEYIHSRLENGGWPKTSGPPWCSSDKSGQLQPKGDMMQIHRVQSVGGARAAVATRFIPPQAGRSARRLDASSLPEGLHAPRILGDSDRVSAPRCWSDNLRNVSSRCRGRSGIGQNTNVTSFLNVGTLKQPPRGSIFSVNRLWKRDCHSRVLARGSIAERRREARLHGHRAIGGPDPP